MNMPEKTRNWLIVQGYGRMDIGDIKLDLNSGKITRTIALDGKVVAEPEFPTGEIDWDIVADALEAAL